jgi:hypothetical protein
MNYAKRMECVQLAAAVADESDSKRQQAARTPYASRHPTRVSHIGKKSFRGDAGSFILPQFLVVTAHKVGVAVGHRIAVDGDECFAGAAASQLIGDAVADLG